MNIYFAAPWFSPKQAEIHKRVHDVICSSGHKVFSPMHECLITPASNKYERKKAFTENITAIHDSQLVVAVTDTLDPGTLWECGVAYEHTVPILYYAETLAGRPFNLMLAMSGIGVIENAKHLYQVLVLLRNGDFSVVKEYEYYGPVE